MRLCVDVDVPSAFSGFMGLSITHGQTNVVLRLCRMHAQHSSVISWQPELLWNTIKYLLAQCKGDCRSHFVDDVLPLVEKAMTVNVYPPLSVTSQPRRGMVRLWDFMVQAEIYTVLCVYLRSIERQLGPSLMSLDFTIVGARRPSDLAPPLPVSSIGQDEFVEQVERALVDNLLLSGNNFRRTGASEWWVVIDDAPSVIDILPVVVSVGGSLSRPSAAAAANRRRSSTVESMGSSSMSMGSSSESRATPKRKVLLATPPPPMSVAPNVVSPTVPVTTFASTPMPMLQTSVQSSRGADPMVPWKSPHFQNQSFAVPGSKYNARSGTMSATMPAVEFSPHSAGHNSAYRAPVWSPIPVCTPFRAPMAYHGVRLNYQGPVPLPEPPPRHAGHVAASGSTPAPSNVPGNIPVSPWLPQNLVATSAITAAPQVASYRLPHHSLSLPTVSPSSTARCRMTAAGKQF